MRKSSFIIFIVVLYSLLVFNLYYYDVIEIPIALLFETVFIILMYSLYDHIKKMTSEIENANKTLKKIISGDVDVRMLSNDLKENFTVGPNVNRLARQIDALLTKKEEDEQTIDILTNNILSPIIYIDIDGQIRYVNEQFHIQFKINVKKDDNYELIRNRDSKLFKLIDDAFILETDQNLKFKYKSYVYHTLATPINNSSLKFVGILFIFHDITELTKYEKLQKDFLADVSHELKTPISAIKGASEILLNGAKHNEDTIIDFLKMIKSENERMELMVRDILLISRLEHTKDLLNKKKMDVSMLLKECTKTLYIKAKRKQQDIITDIAENLYIEGDYGRLKHVFLNLIDNAINYTSDNQNIHLSAHREEADVIVRVKDKGVGISEETLPYIFERFYRVDRARDRNTGGSGLGLAIAKSILDNHGAKIGVKSKVGVGTEFKITFKFYHSKLD
ncbi:sensor histidine kinase [Haloplasma contractile]|uniref:histidine kinase n=1 Tax=Haloplasma contractile SSD-17B TaxID=1033810 RepID=F7PSK5_9MOLU|nr:ATP-binding protein [Haloplasma contractile]ERJ12603.1 Alkaline phosphatase synthesis sensor protein PhoR [Haloplasma contractile SSD-17B]